MHWVSGFLVGFFAMASVWAGTETYDYPIDDRWVATVVGTPAEYCAELPQKIATAAAAGGVFRNRDRSLKKEHVTWLFSMRKQRGHISFLVKL